MVHSILEEATIKTLAVMTKADSNIHPIEVEIVQNILKEELGIELTPAEIRVAAHDEYIENRSIIKYLRKASKDFTLDDKMHLARSLKKVIRADDKTAHAEAEMFNRICEVLKLKPIDLVCL